MTWAWVIIMIGRLANCAKLGIGYGLRTRAIVAYQIKALLLKNLMHFANLPVTSKYHKIQLPNNLQQLKKLITLQTKPNEKCFLLEHMTQLLQSNPKLPRSQIQTFIIQHLQQYKNGSGRHDRIATVAHIIHKLKAKQKVRDLYTEIFDRIYNDQWYVDFYESVKALQAYAQYPQSQQKQQVMQKIQRNLGISINDVPMKYYWQICLSLVQAQRHSSPLWPKLQTFILRNLSLPHSPRLFLDIFHSFAQARQGSSQFYQLCQQVIYRGHLLNNTPSLHSPLSSLPPSGDHFALLVQTYSIIHHNTGMPLQPRLLEHIYQALRAPSMRYQHLGALAKLARYMPGLGYTNEEVGVLLGEILTGREIGGVGGLGEVRDLYGVWQEYFGGVGDPVTARVGSLVVREIERGVLPLYELVGIVDFIVGQEGINQKNQKLIDALNLSIDKKYKYLSTDEAKQVRQALSQNKMISQKIQPQIFLPKPKAYTQLD